MKKQHSFFQKNNQADKTMCNQCHVGHMEKLVMPHTFDYNREGYVPRVCDECGTCSDIERIIKDIGTLTSPLSNKFIKKTLHHIVYTRKIDYGAFKKILQFFKKKEIYSLYHFATLIYDEMEQRGYIVKFDFIVNVLYKYYSPLHSKSDN